MFHSNIEAYLTDEFDLLRSKEDRIKWVLRNRGLVEQGLKEVDSFLTKRTQTKRLTLFAKYFQQAKLEKQKNDLKAALKFCNKVRFFLFYVIQKIFVTFGLTSNLPGNHIRSLRSE